MTQSEAYFKKLIEDHNGEIMSQLARHLIEYMRGVQDITNDYEETFYRTLSHLKHIKK
jgi:DNA-binding phage protein